MDVKTAVSSSGQELKNSAKIPGPNMGFFSGGTPSAENPAGIGNLLERDKKNFKATALNETKKFSNEDSGIPEFLSAQKIESESQKFSFGKDRLSREELVSIFSQKILGLNSSVAELSIDAQMKRKDELENALFTLEKEHLNGLASDSSYYEIKSRIIKELGRLDEKLAQIQNYSEINSEFKHAISDIEELLEGLVLSAKKTEEPEKVEGTLSELTKKYFAGELDEESYYDLKAKLNVKLGTVTR